MEADSTTEFLNTTENVPAYFSNMIIFPFAVNEENLNEYVKLTYNRGVRANELQIVTKLQEIGLLPETVPCLSNRPDCELILKSSRVSGKVQWVCRGCLKRRAISYKSFFHGLECTLLQALQIMLAWCENVDEPIAITYFYVNPKVVKQIYERLFKVASTERKKTLLGGRDSVVLAELYPDCLNQPLPFCCRHHKHRILMMADTNHIPTEYKLNVVTRDFHYQPNTPIDEELHRFLVRELRNSSDPASHFVSASLCLSPLGPDIDPDLQRFITTRLWRDAVALCEEYRKVCVGRGPDIECANTVQYYLERALWLRRLGPNCFKDVLLAVASFYTSSLVSSTTSFNNN